MFDKETKLVREKPLVLLIIILSLVLCPNAQSMTLSVCPSDCNSTTIQGAIDIASSGDTINVATGNYSESVIVDKALTLLGTKSNVNPHGGTWGNSNITVINAGEGNNGILINSSNVTINGFKITESGTDAEVFSLDNPFESAIYVYNENTELENVALIYNWVDDNYGSGIIIRHVNEPVVDYNYISNNGAGVWAAAGLGGQELTGGSISHNEFFNCISYGIYIGGGKVGDLPTNTSGTLIAYNDFHHNEKYGLQLYGYYEPTSVSNSGIRLENNIFHDNGRCGMKITDFTDTLIANNNYSGNGVNGTSDKYKYGALVSAYYTSSGTRFINNTFSDNTLGGIYFLLELGGASLSNITVTHNDFLDDGRGVMTSTRGAFAFPFVITAENNWWGTPIPNSSNVYGNISYYPFCLNVGCSNNIEDELEEFAGGNTTNFSLISNWSAVNLILETGNGQIEWSSPLDLVGSELGFNDAVDIAYRRISVNTGTMPELSHPAILTFASTGFSSTSQFNVFRNGIVCPDIICTNVSISNGNVILNVTALSDYVLSPPSVTGGFIGIAQSLMSILMFLGALLVFMSEMMFGVRDVRILIGSFVFMIIAITLAFTFMHL